MQSPYLTDLIRHAESFLHTPYIYGGNYPRTGLDCSGFACAVLRAVGVVGLKEDLNCDGLYQKLKASGVTQDIHRPVTGSFLFYGDSPTKLHHVALVVSPFSVIESGGGGSTTLTVEEANRLGAGVRKCSINHRSDKIAAVLPAYPWESLTTFPSM